MSGTKLRNIWVLTLDLNPAVTDADRRKLDERVWEVADRVAGLALSLSREAFIWRRQGAVLTVKTQGDPDLLIEIGQWALDNMTSPGPTDFGIKRMMSDPLRLTEGWKGHDGQH